MNNKNKEVRKIAGETHTVGNVREYNSGTCYYIDGKYRRISTGVIIYNWEQGIYMLKSTANIIAGSVLYEGKLISGYFTPNSIKNFQCTTHGTVYFNIEAAIADGKYIRLCSPQNNVVSIPYNKEELIINKQRYASFSAEIYGAKNNPAFDLMIEEHAGNSPSNLTHKNKAKVSQISSLLNPYTYGLEYETSSGNVPIYFLYRYGVVPVKDGSISGHEYITIPLSSKKVIPYTTAICDTLADNTLVNADCSLHLHIGNLPDNVEEFLPAFYCLVYRLQNELHNLFAPYKKKLDYFLNKKGGAKDHCQYIPSLGYGIDKPSEIFDNIIRWVTDDKMNAEEYLSGKKYEVMNNNKWNIKNRYYIIQFLSYLFNNKNSNTVEFRLHSGTYNKYKVLYWVFICKAIVSYSQKYKNRIFSKNSKITLIDVIESEYLNVAPDLYINLKDYIYKRNKDFTLMEINKTMYESLNEVDVIDKQNLGIFYSDYEHLKENYAKCEEKRAQPGKTAIEYFEELVPYDEDE